MTDIVTTAGADAGTAEVAFATSSSVPSVETETSFESLGLSPQLLKAVADSGYTKPTPIQAQGIPHVLKGRDIIGIAQTGTGKTASFTLPMIEILARGRAKARMPRTLILEPTRELAAQVAESFERYGKYHKLSMALLIGGVSFDDQDRKLDRGVDVLIATPGRLLDHFGRGKLMLTGVQVLVIDEADRMLDMGFIPDVEKIAKLTPFTRQTLFYSATMPPEIQRLTDQFLQAPVRVEVSRPATAATTITQVVFPIPGGDWLKREALRKLIRENDVKNAIIFCNRKRDVDVLAKSLQKHGFNAAALHGDLDQSVRTKTLESFKNDTLQFLIASDVAARGLDIPAVSHVFNFDVPFHADDYIHRIGRTGRAGRTGHAFMLMSRGDEKSLAAIEKLTGMTIERRELEGLPVEEEHAHAQPHGRGRDKGRGRGRGRGGREGGSRNEGPRNEGPRNDAPRHENHRVENSARTAVDHGTAEPIAVQAVAQAVVMDRPQHKPKPRPEQRPAPVAAPVSSVVGTRDANQLPAFLLRPVPIAPKTRKNDNES
jgi:superfamily II DNA/RNA helicase